MAAPSDNVFGDLLRRLRKAAGLTQTQLAERAGLPARGVNNLERGIYPRPDRDTVVRLAGALDLHGERRDALIAAARRTGADTPTLAAVPTAPASEHADPAPHASDAPARTLPSGTVTFLFTDIEGSTSLLQAIGSGYAAALATHQRLLRAAWDAHAGVEIDTAGDGFFVAFATAPDALAAAVEATRALAAHPWPQETSVRVRMGLHSGAPQLIGERYVGLDVHRAARIAASGYGGQILLSAAAAELARHELPEDISLRNLGAHRLKDLKQAEHIYQAVVSGLRADFPPLKALDARPHNLPVQSGALLGREREMAAICALLRRDDVHLVTLTGPGGSGKTRLSLQVAAELLDAFPDGVWFIRLSRLSDPELVVPTTATTLDLKESGGVPLAEVLARYLRDKHLLLVLDNFEHVAAAAPRIGELLAACPGVRALATSRVPLHLHDEREYALRPLALPDLTHPPSTEQLSQYAAVALFIERAQAAQAEFQVTNATAPAVAEICARLDGMPLAIVLAAARVKVLPPPALLARLARALPMLAGGTQDVDERQRTMRNTLVWSENLLTAAEQRLFRRLAVFVGGCTLESAEAVCAAPEGAEPLGMDVLEGLSRLVDHSLVQQREEGGEARFGMLHIVREFALEHLEASGESEALRRAHAACVLTWSVDTSSAFRAMGDVRWLAQMEREHDNIRAAVGWFLDQGEAGLGLRLGIGFAPFWFVRGYYTEGRRWLEALAAAELLARKEHSSAEGADRVPDSKALIRAWALTWVYVIASNQGDPTAHEWSGEALNAARASGNKEITAISLLHTGRSWPAHTPGDTQRGQALLEEALAMSQHLSDIEAVMWVRCNYARGLFEVEEERERAQMLFEELLTLGERLSYPFLDVYAGFNLAEIAFLQGDMATAHARADRALRLVREYGVLVWARSCIEVLAWVADRQDDGVRAARLLGADTSIRERMGVLAGDMGMEIADAATRAMLGSERWNAAFAAGRALSLEEAIAEALEEKEAGELRE